jgi:xylulokinase
MALITKDFVSFSLTGARSTDPSDAAGTGLYDQRAGCWAEDICSEVGLSVEQLPPIAAATDTVGRLTSSWAVRTGIPAGTPVAVSATDTACELLSLSITKPGDGLIKIASTGTVVTVLKEPRPDPRILTYPYLEGNWYTVAATNAAATAYRWLQETVFDAVSGSPSATYAEMDQIASTVPAGSDGVLFLPFLTGERSPYWDSDLRAAFLGVSAGHRRPHLCRAVLEGVAFSLRDCRDLLAGLGIPVRQPYFAGGGVASQLWREILASVLKTSGTLAAPQGPALGAAMLAAACVTGTVPLIERAKETVEPDPAWVTIYDRLHPIYRDAARCLTDINHSLVRAQLR